MTISATSAPHGQNPGIVPPWLSGPKAPVVKNPGIVPPWLQEEFHILPVTEEYTILPVTGETQFVRETADLSPMSLADALRAR